MRFLRLACLGMLAVLTMAADAPQKNDLIELKAWLNGRSDAKFRNADNNKIFVLKPGTRGSIEEVKHFPDTKNYGVCLKVLNGENIDKSQRCVWVYFNPKRPNMNLYSVANSQSAKDQRLQEWAKNPKTVSAKKISNDPRQADAAQVTRTVSGIVDAASPVNSSNSSPVAQEPLLPGTDNKPVDTNLSAKAAMEFLNQMNQNGVSGKSPMDPNSSCPDGKCAPSINGYETCTASNDYLSAKITDVSKRDPLLSVLTAQPENMVKESCVKRALESFPKEYYTGRKKNRKRNTYYRDETCEKSPKHVDRPCVSEDYVDMTAKSFNSVATCMSPLLAGSANRQDQKNAAYSVFSLMTQESGLHVNASSSTGAGGASQLTYPAIADVNKNIKTFSDELKSSSNRLCNKLGSMLDTSPMPTGKDSAITRTCSRVSLYQDQPVKNMVYGFAFQHLVKSTLEAQIFNRFPGIFSSLSAGKLDELKLKLAMWAHNTGSADMINPVERVITNMLRKKQTLTDDSVNAFLQNVSSTISGWTRRSKEKAGYYPSIVARMKNLEPAGEKSCLVP